jgi:hypothetical protein
MIFSQKLNETGVVEGAHQRMRQRFSKFLEFIRPTDPNATPLPKKALYILAVNLVFMSGEYNYFIACLNLNPFSKLRRRLSLLSMHASLFNKS